MRISLLFPSLVLLVQLVTGTSTHAQNLLDHSPLIPTDIQITSDGEDLGIQEKHLLRRTNTRIGEVSDDWYGLAYESWHITFVSTKPINRPTANVRFGQADFVIAIYDQSDQLISTRRLSRRLLKIMAERPDSEFIYYEIDLQWMPIVVLERCKRIDIVRDRGGF
ncbi:MAG: hypothetical protein AAF361_13945 [Bacteroidota bacterium]